MSRPAGSGLPLGGSGLTVASYGDFLAEEYLGDYIQGGGAAVRFVVTGGDEVARRWHGRLAAAAAEWNYLYVDVDAADVRVHMIDQIYAALARRVDWIELARRQVAAEWIELGLPAPAGS